MFGKQQVMGSGAGLVEKNGRREVWEDTRGPLTPSKGVEIIL